MTQHIRYMFHAISHSFHGICMALMSALLVLTAGAVLSACTAEEGGDGNTMVTITVAAPPSSSASSATSSAKAGAFTRAISAADEGKVQDLLVLIFNREGYVIGYSYGSNSLGSDKVSVSVKTRKATNCTVYVVANAGTTSGMGAFSSVRTKSDFDALYAQLSSPADLGNGNSLLMFGSLTGYDTSTPGSVALSRLSAKTEVNIVVGDGIILDSYQLCNAPLSAYYVDNKTSGTVSPEGYRDFPVKTPKVTGKTTVSDTYYLFESLLEKGNNKNADGWKGRYKDKAPANATYLAITAHTASWKSTYYVYLGGKELLSDTGTSYDYTDYTIYRNTDYKVTVTLNGGGAAEDGYRVDYDARVLMAGNTLQGWTNGNANINM